MAEQLFLRQSDQGADLPGVTEWHTGVSMSHSVSLPPPGEDRKGSPGWPDPQHSRATVSSWPLTPSSAPGWGRGHHPWGAVWQYQHSGSYKLGRVGVLQGAAGACEQYPGLSFQLRGLSVQVLQGSWTWPSRANDGFLLHRHAL